MFHHDPDYLLVLPVLLYQHQVDQVNLSVLLALVGLQVIKVTSIHSVPHSCSTYLATVHSNGINTITIQTDW